MPIQTFKLTAVIDDYLIETRDVKAATLKTAKGKFRRLFGKRKVTGVRLD